MHMHLQRGKFTFKKKKRDRYGRITIYLVLILVGLYIIHQRQTEVISAPSYLHPLQLVALYLMFKRQKPISRQAKFPKL